jgi:hypothetical protein
MKLDLKKDFATVYAYVKDRVRGFDAAKYDGLGGPGKVKMMQLGYEFAQAGWVVLMFDTRPDAEPDGQWSDFIEGNELQMPHWPKACDAMIDEGELTVIQMDGSETVLPGDTELAIPLGEMLKEVLLKARADGVFASLPKADGCELGVENLDGYYGWPQYEERGEENEV